MKIHLMLTKKMVSMTFIIAVAAMFVFSNTFTNQILAKTSNSKVNTIQSQNDYKNFQNCLSNAGGTQGYATKQEIKDCFNPIYLPSGTNQSSAQPSNTDSSSVNPAGIDFSSPGPISG
jgi:hypothetical protein